MNIILMILGGLAFVVVAVVAWLIWAAYAGGAKSYARLAARIEPVASRLAAGQDPDPADLERFARDRVTRRVLYDALERHQKLALFPPKYLTPALMAEADLIVWLNHPNELGAVADEIELMSTLPVPASGFEHQRYFLFRYRTSPPHWAAKDGWLAGVAGPYPTEGAVTSPAASGTFSRFEPYDSKTPEEHVAATHQLVMERRERK
jgi:hypothetical protein